MWTSLYFMCKIQSFKKYINILLFRIWDSDTVTEWQNRAAKASFFQVSIFLTNRGKSTYYLSIFLSDEGLNDCLFKTFLLFLKMCSIYWVCMLFIFSPNCVGFSLFFWKQLLEPKVKQKRDKLYISCYKILDLKRKVFVFYKAWLNFFNFQPGASHLRDWWEVWLNAFSLLTGLDSVSNRCDTGHLEPSYCATVTLCVKQRLLLLHCPKPKQKLY